MLKHKPLCGHLSTSLRALMSCQALHQLRPSALHLMHPLYAIPCHLNTFILINEFLLTVVY